MKEIIAAVLIVVNLFLGCLNMYQRHYAVGIFNIAAAIYLFWWAVRRES